MTDHTDLLEQSFELNLNNYGPEDVERLNDWAIKAYAALETAQAENAQWRVDFKEMVIERNAALARLAKIESTHIDEVMNGLIMLEKSLANLKAQEPVGTVDRTAPGFVAWVGIPKLKDGSKLFASAGAAPVQPSQEWKPALSPATISTAPAYFNTNDKAMWVLGWNECLNAQPPAPSEAAREYMTGYSDGREWAKPSQALVVEPVYQYQLANGNWIDQTKESYDYNVKHGQATVRMLYATPQAAAQPSAPSDAAITYMTGYSDGREWVGATNQALVGALKDATQSLETIAMLAGRKTYGNPPIETFMETFSEVRGYAISRAGVGREAIAAINAKGDAS